MKQFTSNGSDTDNPLLKEHNPTDLYLILKRGESGSRNTGEVNEEVRYRGSCKGMRLGYIL